MQLVFKIIFPGMRVNETCYDWSSKSIPHGQFKQSEMMDTGFHTNLLGRKCNVVPYQ